MNKSSKLLYIHGFNSTSGSAKAQQMVRFFEQHEARDRIIVPDLPVHPRQAMALLDGLVQSNEVVAVVGSSLGGFYATWLAERHGIKGVLINPAVRPWRLLSTEVGTMTRYHTGETYELEAGWADDLESYAVPVIERPENLLALLQTGDETLNWQDAWDFYQECHTYKGLGGDHSFVGFAAFIPLVLQFCGIQLD
ncbi:MAG TPA: YqiA/YcfP family alpha/beta fold hydrolase [Alcanivoracaceae bacterium]|nr:YqiA/YcfP family alpha/beta fold hydrolase [Alcanivoracaceae bacterium]